MRILFIAPSRLGDAVIASGAMEHVRCLYPDARVTVACGAATAGAFARLPGLERLIVFEKRRLDAHWADLWLRCAPHLWEVVVDFRGSAVSFALLAKRRLIVRGGRRPGRRYRQIGASLGLDPAPLPVAWIAPEDHAKAESLLPPGPPILALGPTANWIGKVWPAENFAEAVRRLASGKLAGARIAIFGGPGEQERAQAAALFEALPDALDLVGRLSVAESAACIARASLFIGNDSGLMHLSAAAAAPTLGLFGRSRASEYAPAGRRTAIAVAPGPEGEAPMAGLTVDAVVAEAEALLETASPQQEEAPA